MIAKRWGGGHGVCEMGEDGQKVQTFSNKSWDVMYSMMTSINNTVMDILKFLKNILKSSHPKKNKFVTVWWCM